jgi:hypothetical protein
MYKTILFVSIDDCEHIPDNCTLQWRILKSIDLGGGGAGGLSTLTLNQVHNNRSQPEE